MGAQAKNDTSRADHVVLCTTSRESRRRNGSLLPLRGGILALGLEGPLGGAAGTTRGAWLGAFLRRPFLPGGWRAVALRRSWPRLTLSSPGGPRDPLWGPRSQCGGAQSLVAGRTHACWPVRVVPPARHSHGAPEGREGLRAPAMVMRNARLAARMRLRAEPRHHPARLRPRRRLVRDVLGCRGLARLPAPLPRVLIELILGPQTILGSPAVRSQEEASDAQCKS